MEPTIQVLTDQTVPIVAEFSEASYLILFGSQARGSATPRSDIDLAVGGGLDHDRRAALEHALEATLGRTVQVVVAAKASPALRARVFREGIVLWERDREERVRDHARAFVDYVDYQPVEALYLARVRDRLMGGDEGAR